MTIIENWLPEGKKAAVCFTIDDVHPGRSTDAYEAGGDLGRGALGHVEKLLERHPSLHVSLFTTADWREISPVATRKLLARVPLLRERVYLTDLLPEGTMRLDRHPEFVRYLRELPRTEVGLHGLHHVHRGPTILVEFQEQSTAECKHILRRALSIFHAAGLPRPAGMTPPGWNAPPSLVTAMGELGFSYVASARDIVSPITAAARAEMSGIRGVSLLYPALLHGGRVVHLPANFQATSRIERALEIVQLRGLLSVKAHIIKDALGYIAVDGVDALYCNYLDALFHLLENRFGDSLWWTTMEQVAARAASAARSRQSEVGESRVVRVEGDSRSG
jgi:hypothetical protein